MSHGCSRISGWWVLTWALTVVMVLAGPCLLQAAETPRIMVYLEVPASVPSMSLFLGEFHLVGASPNPVPLALSRTTLVAEDIAGRQILLTSTPAPAGRYTSLHLGLAKISGKVGVAEVDPEPSPEGLSIPLDLELVSGSTATVFLEWKPTAIDPEAPFHVPAIESRNQVIPPLGSLAFATSAGSGSVMVCNRPEARVVSALAVDEDPRGLAYSRTGQHLFVALAAKDAIAVVDVLSLRVINTVPLQFGDDPTRLLLSHDEATLYVLCPGSRTLAALSVWSLQEQFRLAVGEGPRSLAQDPVSGMLFVACEDEGRIQVVDPATGSVTRSLALLSAPAEMAIDDLAHILFVGGGAQRLVRTFNLTTEENVGDQNICGPVAGLAVNPRTRRVYASVPGCRNLAVIRPDLGIEYGSIPLDGSPGLMDFDQNYSQLWVVLPRQGAVAVCHVNSGVVATRIEIDSDPFEVLVP